MSITRETSIFRASPLAPGSPAPASLRSVAGLLREVGSASALLSVEDLRAYWLSVMADRRVSARDRLAASRMYADSVGAFSSAAAASGTSGAVRWLEAEVVAAGGAEPAPAEK